MHIIAYEVVTHNPFPTDKKTPHKTTCQMNNANAIDASVGSMLQIS